MTAHHIMHVTSQFSYFVSRAQNLRINLPVVRVCRQKNGFTKMEKAKRRRIAGS
jgi:hypothetical protein